MAIRYQDENGNWVTGQKAIETKITDQQGNFESDNVEGALRELANGVKANADVTKLEATIQANSSKIGSLQTSVNNLQSDMTTAQEDIEWLKINGGGGGGTAVPTITSTFKDTSIDKGNDVTIPIFFSSPNKGNGTAYILVNNVQVDTTGLKQGNNNVRVSGQFLTSQTENLVAIYAKDRAGIVSNQLSWTVVAGGIELTTTFDYEADYGITDTIRIDYNIDTGIKETITLTLDIDNNVTTYIAVNGGNFIDIAAADLGLGTHVVKMYATVGKYTSKTLSFNLVIVSTTELYLSSSFDQTKDYTYGVPISVNYRLSKQSTEEFNVSLKIDDKTVKTQKLTVGSYYWTIQSLSEGTHTLTIHAVSLDYSEDKSITLTVKVVMGEYTPVEDYTSGLICDLNAVGKSNDDDEVLVDNLWKDSSGNGHDAKLVNFNYGTNGFVNDVLVCDNDAYAVIEWSPWERNAITGSTIDIIYEPINSGIEDCRVLDYTQITDDTSTAEIKPFKGLYADILNGIVSSASSGTSAGKINIDDESGEIHLTWVLDRTNKFMKTYINGVLSRIMFLSDSGNGVNKVYEDFSLDSNIYLNSTKGKNCGTNNIKRFRVYDHALTSDQVLQNHLANITDLTKQEEEYNFNYNNTTLPKMYLTGDTTNMTASQTVPMKIEYVSPNEEKYGQSFNTGIQNNPVRIQGTSSLQYVRHNYTIFLKDEYGADMLYNPYGSGSKPENVFCLKADYVESSHANNTGMAKFINDCVYDTKTPMQLADSDCRTTINGFPIEVYMNGEYLGVYNFNHDRYSYKSYGYDYTKYPNILVYEINSNSNTSAGAFYRYGDNAESSANVSELDYYKRDFNLIYGNRTTDSDSYSEIKTLVQWVSVAEQDLFREMISEHFNKEYLFRYFLTVLMIGAVDSLGKNMKIMTVDGKVWYPTFYDLDTVLGIDNSGYLTIQPDVEIESGSYNTSNSNLWSKVWNYFNTELKEEWAKMRQGSFTLDNLMNYIYGEQISKIPAKLYNDDAQVKYLEFGSLYTYCCHGSKEHQIRRWLRERIAYVDSMLGYFTSQEDQVTIRMNKTGKVSFEVTPYIPLYFSVKWSNATGGTQTFKLKRGETKTFTYSSTTSTDQEVLIYHAKYIKRLDNLSNLNPSSCILSNATKLTNVEIHSSKLYNINVTNNKFLRSINLENCTALGTVTATGSSLNLSNCKYLRYCNVYNTNLTEVQLNTSGGSLTEIYYPKTIQSINLVKQRLLELIGLPYGEGGKEVPTSLYTISIQDCPSITKLNTSSDTTIASSFASMVYVNNLTIRNSLDLASLKFDGFHRLQNVTIENMYNLEEVGFNNLLPVGETSTIKYIGMSNCPKLGTIELNCTSNDYEITFADDAILNFGGLFKLNSITSNCVLKGIKTLVVPINLESMFFTSEYGSGYSTIENIWVSSQCNVDTQATTPIVTHVDPTYSGIDFLGMNLKNIDLGALVNIPKAINFKLSPTTVNPHFNLNRDGETYKYLQPVGTLDLSNYTESLAKFFDGVDLDKLEIICNNNLPQTDLSYCFYNSTFSTNEAINKLLTKVSSITNLDYCFYRTTINSVDILEDINMGESSSMNYTFAECPNIKELNSVVIPSNVTSVEGMFNKCPLTVINNMVVNVRGSISGLFKGCNKLTTINTLRIPNVTDVSNTFDGCTSLSSLSGFELPSSCTNVSNLFNGCYMLTDLSMNFGSNITVGDNWYPPNLEALHDTTISNDYVKLTNCSTLKTVNNLTLRISVTPTSFFNGCAALKTINYIDIGGTLTSVKALFKDMNLTSLNNVTFSSSSIIDYSECFRNVQCINNSTVINFPTFTDNNITMSSTFNSCKGLTSIVSLDYSKVYNMTAMYWSSGITSINDIQFDANICDLVFGQCINLSSINNVSFPNATSMRQIFYNTAITDTSLTIPDSCTNISEMFKSCTNLTDISGMTFGSGITTATDCIKDVPLVYANDITIKSFFKTTDNNYKKPVIMFTDCTSLVSAKNLKLITSLDSINVNDMFARCTNLADVNFVNPPKFGYCNYLFQNTSISKNTNGVIRLYEDLGITVNTLSGATSIAMFRANPYIKEVIFPDEEFGNFSAQQLFDECTNLKIVRNLKSRYLGNMFRFCKGATNVELINCYITNPFVADGCSGITKLTNCTIPDSVTNIDNMFNGIGITDISGLTIGSGVTSATDWITGSAITTANNVTIKNGASMFNGCTTLTTCNNLTITSTCTSLSALFKGCTSLTSYSFSPDCDTRNVTSIQSMFESCSKLEIIDFSSLVFTSKLAAYSSLFMRCRNAKEIYFPESIKDSSVTDISYLFLECTPTKISNLKFPASLTTVSWCFTDVGGINYLRKVVETPGLEFCSQQALNIDVNATKGQGFTIFRYHAPKKITDITFSGDCTDISYLCQGGSALVEDFIIPSHITNCSNTFKNCTNITHVHSNWNNSYDNGITSTDCYAGCTGITHIDDENVITYEGKEGLDEIPEAWGGYEFTKETTCVLEVVTTESNYRVDLTYTKTDTTNYITSWGDGTVDTLYYHTYESPGTYIIKTRYPSIFTNGSAINMRSVLTRVLQMRKTLVLNDFCFRDCSNLTYLNIDNCIITNNTLLYNNPSLAYISANNVKFESSGASSPFVSGKGYGYGEDVTEVEIIGVETWDVSKFTNFDSLFKGAKITSLDLSNWDVGNSLSFQSMFHNCKNLKTITGLENWNTSKCSSFWNMFNSCSSLITANLSGFDLSNGSNCQEMFSGCTKLESLNLNWKNMNKKPLNLFKMFGNCSSLSHIDFTGWDTSTVWKFNYVFEGCTMLDDETLQLTATWDLSNCTELSGLYKGCTQLASPPITTFGNNTSYQEFYSGCTFTAEGITFKVVDKCAISRVFASCRNLTSTINFEWDTDQPVNVSSMFVDSYNVSVLGNFNLTSCTNLFDSNFLGGMFASTYSNLTTFNCYGVQSYSLNVSKYPNLSKESILKIINCLCDNGNDLTLTLGSTNMSKLSDSEIAIATAKGWTVV